MLADDRLNAIVKMVVDAGSMSVADLAEALDVTASTIRRDLQALDRAHRLVKVHGGATSLERAHIKRDLTIPERSGLHVGDKRSIAHAAAELIEPGSFVYIDSGSTTLQLVSCVPVDRSIAYVTNSVGHARRMMERGCRVMVTGGELKPETEALVGPDATAMLKHYRFACGFWGANGISQKHGMTSPDPLEAEVKRVAMGQTERRYVLADASKFGMEAAVSFAGLDGVAIITAGDVPSKYMTVPGLIHIDNNQCVSSRGVE